MKKLFTLSILFALASIVFISCKSSSLLKRRYNRGYYVHHAAKHSEPKVNEKVAYTHKVSPVATEQVKPTNIAPALSVNNTPVIVAGVNAPAVKPSGAVKADLKKPAKSIPLAMAVKKPFKTIGDLSAKVRSADAAGDALSLLWIIILVLLILYLLSFAFDGFGLGGFIHLLAIIIVILLILWLLRIL